MLPLFPHIVFAIGISSSSAFLAFRAKQAVICNTLSPADSLVRTYIPTDSVILFVTLKYRSWKMETSGFITGLRQIAALGL